MEKETFVEQVLNSVNGISTVLPSDELWHRIEVRLREKSVVPLYKIVMVAASVAILLCINVIAVTKTTRQSTVSPVAALESFISKSNHLY